MASYLCIYPPSTNTWEPAVSQAFLTVQECIDQDPGAFVVPLASSFQNPTLQDIFAVPLAEDMAQMWALGFGLPMTCYLVAWGFGAVLNFIDKVKPY